MPASFTLATRKTVQVNSTSSTLSPAFRPGAKKGSGTFCAQHPLRARSGKRFLTPFSPRCSCTWHTSGTPPHGTARSSRSTSGYPGLTPAGIQDRLNAIYADASASSAGIAADILRLAAGRIPPQAAPLHGSCRGDHRAALLRPEPVRCETSVLGPLAAAYPDVHQLPQSRQHVGKPIFQPMRASTLGHVAGGIHPPTARTSSTSTTAWRRAMADPVKRLPWN